MSFVGLVTRKDKPTGVRLMAKVVTENKKKWAKKTFNVSVKAAGIDDMTCCILDHATAVEKIITTHDLSQLVDNVTLTYSGANGTTITYRIVDIDVPYLSTYMTDDGKVLGRPKFGEGDAVGHIEITVTKGDTGMVTSRIQTTVMAITAEEVLNSTTFTQAGLWALIGGANEAYQQNSEASGHNNILKPLSLVQSRSIPDMSTEPVTIKWSVVDETLPFTTGIYTEPRINIETGAVTRCTYKEACTLIDVIPNATATVKVVGSTNNALQNRVRIGGLVLTATLTLGQVTRDVVFNCSTISKYITNEEVLDVVLNNLYLQTDDEGKYQYKTDGSSSYETLLAPTTGGTMTLTAFSNRGSELFEAPELKLGLGQIIGVTLESVMYNYGTMTLFKETHPAIFVDAYNKGFNRNVDDTLAILTIDFDKLKDATEEQKRFTCGIKIGVSGYSATGDEIGGGSTTADRTASFQIDTSKIAAA